MTSDTQKLQGYQTVSSYVLGLMLLTTRCQQQAALQVSFTKDNLQSISHITIECMADSNISVVDAARQQQHGSHVVVI